MMEIIFVIEIVILSIGINLTNFNLIIIIKINKFLVTLLFLLEYGYTIFIIILGGN